MYEILTGSNGGCPYCQGKDEFLRQRGLSGGCCPHHAVMSVTWNYICELLKGDRLHLLSAETNGHCVTFRREPDPIWPPDQMDTPQSLSICRLTGEWRVASERYHTKVGRNNPEAWIIQRLFEVASLLPSELE